MNLKTVILDNNEYYIIKEIKMNNNYYYILSNCDNNLDICVRKKIVKNNIEYLVGLTSEQEFDNVFEMYNKIN